MPPFALAGFFAFAALVQPGPASAPASQPASSLAAAASQPTSGDAEVDSILDRLETKGAAVTDFAADVTREQIQTFPFPDTTTDRGRIYFRKLQPTPKFLVEFTEVIAGNVKRTDKNWYLFDGEKLTECHENTKTVVQRELVAKGEKIDVYKLGQGPIPLPIGQSRRDMLENFRIVKGTLQADDPKNCDHLVCEPRSTSPMAQQFRVVHFYIDRKLDLPVRIVADRAGEDSTIRASFDKIEINSGLAASRFEVKIPAGYVVTTAPLSDSGKPRK